MQTKTIRRVRENSHTQKSVRKYSNVIDAICNRINITRDEWLLIMFEYGYQFVQYNYESEELRVDELQNRESGFWDFFLHTYLINDEIIASSPHDIDINKYHNIKRFLIYSNEKIQEEIKS